MMFKTKKPLTMIRRGYIKEQYILLLPICLRTAEQELAPNIPQVYGTGCYGVIGPDPSTVLDKRKIF
jgi:hypothetical protein